MKKMHKLTKETAGDILNKCAQTLNDGGIAVVPTETVYGFACDAFNIEAQKKIYAIKGRDFRKPLILFPDTIENARMFVDIPNDAIKIINKFWPGQLTLVFATTEMGKMVSGGRKDLGVRIPDNKFLLNLLKTFKKPLFTTSANLSGTKSIKNGDDAHIFEDHADIIINSGICKFSLESTVIDMIKFPYIVIRKGCLDTKKILACI
ncbi:MAG: L-threonylcarbamoyladenylate synthase [Elusimicrobia bacterium]|nr:L-threonylcarbamoyladenylate synthase [Elusimicrobiota bacterium]